MDIFNTFFYIIIFIMGTVFGSFYTLATYRIPRGESITHNRSYCPNCNHKLGFFDMIPIISYVCLFGRCRYCKEKIRPRYLILEILSGMLFVVFAIIMKLNIYNLNIITICELSFTILYLTFVILMAGTDRENIKIEKGISIYGILIALIYIIYLCIVEKANIYRYVIYLILYIVVLILDSATLRKYAKSTYVNGILLTIITMAVFTGEYVSINTIIVVLLIIFIYMLSNKIKQKTRKYKSKVGNKKFNNNLSIGYFLGVANIICYAFTIIASDVFIKI